MDLKRGDVAIVSAPGSYGKPRPSVILQSDFFDDTGSLTVLLMTSDLRPDSPLIRRRIGPTERNGLRAPTDIMIDKLFSIPRDRFGQKIGHLGASEMAEIAAAVAVFLGI